MGKRRILKTLAVMGVMLCVAAVPAMAQSELDQSQTDTSHGWLIQQPDKQSFTAQKTGTLDRVLVNIAYCEVCYYGNGGNITVEIKGPDGDTLGEATSGLLWSFHWYDFPFSDPAPFVQAGKQYAIELTASEPGAGVPLGGARSDVYPGGEFSYWDSAANDWVTRSDFELAFQTYVTPDTAAPMVNAVNPAEGVKGVARSTNVTATFSESMAPATLNTSTFKLFKINKDGTTSRITDAPVKLSADGLTAELNPFGSSNTRLAKNTKYKAVVTTGAKDLAGNALDQDAATSGNQQKVWYFTTGTT